jgi:hypothetical protein
MGYLSRGWVDNGCVIGNIGFNRWRFTMFDVGPMEYAPEFLAKIVEERIGKPKAFAFFRMYDESSYPSLRDRTPEARACLKGMVGNLKAAIVTLDFTGREMAEFGFEIIGANASHNFRIMVA